MAINETLKFSWGHIIAFIALIFISYISFMGITYLTDGDFLCAGLGVLIINLVLITFFVIPQILKGTEEKFSKKIVFERVLFFSAPLFFILAMLPFAHFWTVYGNRGDIERIFSESVQTTKNIFTSYETYANTRIKEYDEWLVQRGLDSIRRKNAVEALRLQMKADNYEALKELANGWINDASDATVWNVFMIGDIDKIESAIEGWNKFLTDFSGKMMADEPEGVEAFTSTDPSVIEAKNNLSNLHSIYQTKRVPTMIAIVISMLLYLLLLFPYVIQSRNTKSTFRLIGSEGDTYTLQSKRRKKTVGVDHSEDDMIFIMGDDSSSSNGDYDSFTM